MENNRTFYLNRLLPESEEWSEKLEEQAVKDDIPIMDPVSMQFVMQLVRLQKPKRILELGTAIGYSALQIAAASPESEIVTIERDELRFKQAQENIKALQMQDRIEILFGDALEMAHEVTEKSPFDLLLIDAAKGQYQRFFDLYHPLILKGGVILTDNVLFKGYVDNPNKQHPRFAKLGQKIRQYNDWLCGHSEYITSVVPIGDGVAISYKK